jgi:hypothetical protein
MAVLECADVVDGLDDEVHRHDVDAPALQAHAREPRRQDLPHALDELEEVVGPVDLVHLAGGRVAHHQRRAVHRPGHLALLAHDLLALVLGHEVGVLEVLGLVEHVLAEHALVQAGGGDAAHVVQVAGLDGLGELAHVARAVDVDGHLAVGVGAQVVHGGQVVDGVDLALERLQRVGGHAQLPGRQVAGHGRGALLRGAAEPPVLVQRRQLALAAFAHEEADRGAAAREQGLDEALADEAGGAGDEVVHGRVSCAGCWRAAAASAACSIERPH